jgi:hypothetical protein
MRNKEWSHRPHGDSLLCFIAGVPLVRPLWGISGPELLQVRACWVWRGRSPVSQ